MCSVVESVLTLFRPLTDQLENAKSQRAKDLQGLLPTVSQTVVRSHAVLPMVYSVVYSVLTMFRSLDHQLSTARSQRVSDLPSGFCNSGEMVH